MQAVVRRLTLPLLLPQPAAAVGDPRGCAPARHARRWPRPALWAQPICWQAQGTWHGLLLRARRSAHLAGACLPGMPLNPPSCLACVSSRESLPYLQSARRRTQRSLASSTGPSGRGGLAAGGASHALLGQALAAFLSVLQASLNTGNIMLQGCVTTAAALPCPGQAPGTQPDRPCATPSPPPTQPPPSHPRQVTTFRNRNLRLPEDADGERISEASYEDGVRPLAGWHLPPGMHSCTRRHWARAGHGCNRMMRPQLSSGGCSRLQRLSALSTQGSHWKAACAATRRCSLSLSPRRSRAGPRAACWRLSEAGACL